MRWSTSRWPRELIAAGRSLLDALDELLADRERFDDVVATVGTALGEGVAVISRLVPGGSTVSAGSGHDDAGPSAKASPRAPPGAGSSAPRSTSPKGSLAERTCRRGIQMRLVRFDDDAGGFSIELHPLITVISGLPPHVRERLVHAIAALPRAEDPGCGGTLLVHGVYLDLTVDNLRLLELHHDIDVVLERKDVPGSDLPMDDAGAPVSVELLDLETAQSQLDRHLQAVDDATVAYESAVAEVEATEAEREAVHRSIATARDGLDTFAAAELNVARDELDEALKAGEVPSTTSADDIASIMAEVESLIEDSNTLRRNRRALRRIDVASVRCVAELDDALGRHGSLPTGPDDGSDEPSVGTDDAEVRRIPSPEAAALADEWVRWARRHEAHLDAEPVPVTGEGGDTGDPTPERSMVRRSGEDW
ncbi:MAG: hypothetical protein R2698_00485 [Microthrixaceae bacterium]